MALFGVYPGIRDIRRAERGPGEDKRERSGGRGRQPRIEEAIVLRWWLPKPSNESIHCARL